MTPISPVVAASQRRIPCRILRGQTEYLATALHVEVGQVVLLTPTLRAEEVPGLGEEVRLEMSLVENDEPTARCLAAKARVVKVADRADGLSEITLRLRKTAFRKKQRVGQVQWPKRTTESVM